MKRALVVTPGSLVKVSIVHELFKLRECITSVKNFFVEYRHDC